MKDSLFKTAPWILREADEAVSRRLAESLDIHGTTARILAGRGVRTPEEAGNFLSPSLERLPDPSSLSDADRAATRLADAVGRGERIAVFGDYDVDGIAAAALMSEFLEAVGASPIVALPRRREEGYGITPEAVDKLKDRGARLILTVDNGIGAHAAVARARELGVAMIVTDHHRVMGEPAAADAVINPKLAAAGSGMENLAGCGVAFMLALALRRKLRETGGLTSPEPNLKRMLDLVALGTIADAVPLTGANRILVSFGLREIAASRRPGIRALMEVSGTAPSEIDDRSIGFRLAPRINAAGRLGDPHDALRLMLSKDIDEARAIAGRLDCANRERQGLQEQCLREALAMIEDDPAAQGAGALVVDSDNWHVGVIGIVASKLAERFGRPAVVITRETSPARGSGRSARGVDIARALSECSDLLARFGGHREAAGLSMDCERIAELGARFSRACAAQLADLPTPSLVVDAIASPQSISSKLVGEIERLAPFGEGNPEPVLAFRGAGLVDQRIVGTGHLKLTVSAEGLTFGAIGFGMSEPLPSETRLVDLAFTPAHNTYNGITSIQLRLHGIAPLP